MKKEIWAIDEDEINRMDVLSPWLYQGEIFDIKKHQGNAVGFEYRIEYPNGQKYLGAHKFPDMSYVTSGSMHKKYVRKYGTNGIRRIITKLHYSLEELTEGEYESIEKYGAVSDPGYFNLVNLKHPFSNDEWKVIAVDENNEKKIYGGVSEIRRILKQEMNVSVCEGTIRSWLNGKSLGFQYHFADIYYERYSAKEKEVIDEKRKNKLMKNKSAVVVKINEGVWSGETRWLYNAGIFRKKMKVWFGVEIKPTTLYRVLDGEALQYREWAGIDDVYLLQHEICDTKNELERKRNETWTRMTEKRKFFGDVDYVNDKIKITYKDGSHDIFKNASGVMKKFNKGRELVRRWFEGRINSWMKPEFNIRHIEYRGMKLVNDNSYGQKLNSIWAFKNGEIITAKGIEGVAELFNISKPKAMSWLSETSKTWKKHELGVLSYEYRGNHFTNDMIFER